MGAAPVARIPSTVTPSATWGSFLLRASTAMVRAHAWPARRRPGWAAPRG